MPQPVPVVVLASTDTVERDAALVTALVDLPGVVAIAYEIREDDEDVALRRLVCDGAGVWQDTAVAMEHPCPGCAVREDAVPLIAETLEREVAGVVLALPTWAEILPATRTLVAQMAPGGLLDRARLGATVTVTAAGEVPGRLRESDDALLAQLVGADVVVVPDGAREGAGGDLVDAFRWRESVRYDDVCEPWLAHALAERHDDEALERRLDPATLEPGHGFGVGVRRRGRAEVAPSGVWRMDLRSTRPFHPDRLMAGLAHLAPERTVSLGRFWLPNRPDALCGWEAVGGAVCVGVAGTWDGEAETRLLVVGTEGDGEAVARAFTAALLTDEEVAAGLHVWLGRADPLTPYLGDPVELYRSGPPAR